MVKKTLFITLTLLLTVGFLAFINTNNGKSDSNKNPNDKSIYTKANDKESDNDLKKSNTTIEPNINIQDEFIYCEKDSDCIKVSEGVCGCNSGGKAIAINKKYQYNWENKHKNDRVMCPTVISNDKSCFTVVKCVNNSCSLITNE